MKLFGRYLFRQAFSALMLILLSLTGVVWIATALKQLQLITSEGQDAFIFFRMTLLALPNLIAMIAPIALLIASIHTLNRLNTDSELIVMTASGATVWLFARPLLLLSASMSVLLLVANLYVLPWSVRTLQDYVVKIRTDLISQVMQPGEFSSPETNLTFHIRDRRPNGEILGLLMHDGRDKKQTLSYLAERGEIVNQGAQAFLVMHDGQIVRQEAGAEGAQVIEFESYVVDLSALGPKTSDPNLKPRARYLEELLNPDPQDNQYRRNPGSFRSEIHERFASALYPIVFAMFALAFLGIAQTNRQNRTRNLLNAFAAAIGARLTGLAATNLVTLNAQAVPLVYAVPIVSIIVATLLARYRMTPHRSSRLELWLQNRIETVRAMVAPLFAKIVPARWRQRPMAAARPAP